MSKQKVVVRRFKCRGAGSDCPPYGFEVLRAKHTQAVQSRDMLLDTDLDRLKGQNIKVVVVK